MSSNPAPTLGLLDPLTGPFLALHGFLYPADDLDLVVENDLHLLVGFDAFVDDLPKVYEDLGHYFGDCPHIEGFQDPFDGFVGPALIAELHHHHVNLEE